MPLSRQEVETVAREADCLYNQSQVEAALDAMAREIGAAMGDQLPLVLCVMTGGIIPAGHLLTRLHFPLEVDYLHATRYQGKTEGGQLHWIARPRLAIKDRCVLIVDDILDVGATLAAIVAECKSQGARSVYTAVLADKRHDRKHGIQADFVGLEVVDRYVFGYGMDYKGYLRNMPGIYALKDS